MPNNDDKLAAAAAAAQQQQQMVTDASVAQLHKELVTNISNAILPEAIFVEYFLDMFLHPEKHIESTLRSKWVELAGGYYNEVDVVGNDGNKIFTVPGLMLADAISHDSIKGYDFPSIASYYSMKKSITSAQATNYLSGILSGVADAVRPNVEAHIARWSTIFERYATPESDIVATVGKMAAPTKKRRKEKVSTSILDL